MSNAVGPLKIDQVELLIGAQLKQYYQFNLGHIKNLKILTKVTIIPTYNVELKHSK
jgi:hypothetical protein